MQLNNKTMTVLKNFSSINPSLVFNEGNVLSTMSVGKTIISKAKVPDNFPKKFAMANLGRFINSVTSYDNASLAFNDKDVTITGQNPGEKSKLIYGSEDTIKTPPDKIINNFSLPSVDASCTLTPEALASVQKQLGILGVPEIAFVGDGSEILLQAVDSKNPTSDTFSIKIGDTDKNFRAIFKAENIKMIPGTYTVDISKGGISHFKGEDIEYWIAVESNSTF